MDIHLWCNSDHTSVMALFSCLMLIFLPHPLPFLCKPACHQVRDALLIKVALEDRQMGGLGFSRIVTSVTLFWNAAACSWISRCRSNGHPWGTTTQRLLLLWTCELHTVRKERERRMIWMWHVWESGAVTGRFYKDAQLTAHTNFWHPTNGSSDPALTAGFKGIRNKLTPGSFESCF